MATAGRYRRGVPNSSRLPWRVVALSTVLALVAAIGTYRLLADDSAAVTAGAPAGDVLSLSPEDPVDPADAVYRTFKGEEVALSSLRGTPTVVNFFASTCTPCIIEMPEFEMVYQEVKDDVAFLGLAVADRPDDALALVDQTGVTYPTAQDPDGTVISALGGSVLPTTVLLGADGSILARRSGQMTANDLRALLTEELGGP